MLGWADLINQYTNLYGAPVNDITNPISANSVADREYNANREDTQYQRLRQDLSAAGLNGWLAVNGAANPSAQAISNTSEAASRANEIGFRYRNLLTEGMKFAEKQIQSAAENQNNNVWDFVTKIVGNLFSPRLF